MPTDPLTSVIHVYNRACFYNGPAHAVILEVVPYRNLPLVFYTITEVRLCGSRILAAFT